VPYAVIQRAIDPSLKMLDINLDDDDEDEFRLQYDAKQLDIDLEDGLSCRKKRGGIKDGLRSEVLDAWGLVP
jgi:hypothetical protein